MHEHAHTGLVRGGGNLFVGGLDQRAEGGGGDKGAVLCAQIVPKEPAVHAAAGNAADDGSLMLCQCIQEFRHTVGIGDSVHQCVAHQPGVPQGGEQKIAVGQHVFFVFIQLHGQQLLAVVHIKFRNGEFVILPVLNDAADAFAFGLAVEAPIDVAVNIPESLPAETGQLPQLGIVAPCGIGVFRQIDIPAGGHHRKIGMIVEIVAEAGRGVVRNDALDDLLGCHGGTPLQIKIL